MNAPQTKILFTEDEEVNDSVMWNDMETLANLLISN